MLAPDLFKDSLPKARGVAVVGDNLVHGFRHVAFDSAGLDIQPGKLDGMIVNVHVGIGEELPLEIVGTPTDDAGTTKLVAQVTDQLEGQFGPRIRNPEVNLQFFNPAFHVRPFAAGDGFVSHHDPASVAKGRPVGRPA